MKLALSQMSMTESMEKNLQKSLEFCDRAAGADLVLFPEIQLSPFFPQYEKRDGSQYCLKEGAGEIEALRKKAEKYGYYVSPNLYLERQGNCYDTSLWITPDGSVADRAEMVHIAQAPGFYEQDYYTPSDGGFRVFDTPFGRVGIVICYDRHLPESIRICALKGADLILIPTANTKAEPMELFEWEIRVQAMQSSVFIAMCNRVGREGEMDFSGESLVAAPDGSLFAKAGDREELLMCELDLAQAALQRKKMPYWKSRRPECYLELTKR